MCNPLQIKAEVKADLTYAANTVADMSHETHIGIGKIFYACYGPWVEQRVRKAKLIASQVEKDTQDILAGRKQLEEETGKLIELPEPFTIDALCYELTLTDNKCKAKRLAKTIMLAAGEIKQIPEDEISGDYLNQTFFNRWRKEAELIDDEDLRKWWAHLLVEETKKPNTISPRTLDVAKNLSKEEAELFSNVCKFCWNDFFIVAEDNALFNHDQRDLVTLQDAGLLTHSFTQCAEELYAGKFATNPYTVFPFTRVNLAIVISLPNCGLDGFQLTRAGKELYKIIPKRQNLEHLIYIAKRLGRKHPEAQICIFNLEKFIKLNTENFAPWNSAYSIWRFPYKQEIKQNDHR